MIHSGKTLRYFIWEWHLRNPTKKINQFLTFNFSPVDSNFCYRYSQVLSYVKKFYIKCPEIEQEKAKYSDIYFQKEGGGTVN